MPAPVERNVLHASRAAPHTGEEAPGASFDGGGGGRALLVSFRFPPQGGVGVHRIAGFTKYLPQYGWEPHVLTGPAQGGRHLEDPTLLGALQDGCQVTRSGHMNTKAAMRWLRRLRLDRPVRMLTPCFPMMDAGWIPHGYRVGLRVLRERPFDLIWSSSYPMASHFVAYLLKRKTGLPWVADYRDEWSLRPVLQWPTPLHRAVARRLDRLVTEAADRVVTTSPAHTESFARAFSGGDGARYRTITNGFDEDDFRNGDGRTASPLVRADRFTVAHVGTLNGGRSADGLVAAVQSLIAWGRVPADRIELLFVGNTKAVEDLGLESRGVLRRVEYLPHREAVGVMAAADVLLLVNDERENILAKTFEYLAAGRPILALAPPGATAEVVEGARAGAVLDPADAEGIADHLAGSFRRWRAGRLRSHVDPEVIRGYSRRALTRRLAAVFDDTMKETRQGPFASKVESGAPAGLETHSPEEDV